MKRDAVLRSPGSRVLERVRQTFSQISSSWVLMVLTTVLRADFG